MKIFPSLIAGIYLSSIIGMFAGDPMDYSESLEPIRIMAFVGYSGLLLFFIAMVLEGGTVPSAKESLWVLFLLCANVIAMPLFWWWYILNRPNGEEKS